MRTRDRRAADLLQLATVAAAALVGGLLAMLVLAIRGELRPGIVLFVVVAVTLLAVLTVGTLQTSPRRDAKEPPWPRPWEPPEPPGPGIPGPGCGSSPPSDPTWYDDIDEVPARAQGRAAPPSFPPPVAPAPPPDTRPPAYETCPVPGAPKTAGRPVHRIVQCPGCGDFEVEVHPEGDHLVFTCLRRGHRWSWARGRPWPATVVRPAALPVSDTDSS